MFSTDYYGETEGLEKPTWNEEEELEGTFTSYLDESVPSLHLTVLTVHIAIECNVSNVCKACGRNFYDDFTTSYCSFQCEFLALTTKRRFYAKKDLK